MFMIMYNFHDFNDHFNDHEHCTESAIVSFILFGGKCY